MVAVKETLRVAGRRVNAFKGSSREWPIHEHAAHGHIFEITIIGHDPGLGMMKRHLNREFIVLCRLPIQGEQVLMYVLPLTKQG